MILELYSRNMRIVRRLPGYIFYHKYVIILVILAHLMILYLLLRWNLICLNAQAWRHINKVCNLYEKGKAVGTLCPALCSKRIIQKVTCHSFSSSKKAVFSAEYGNKRIVLKSVTTENIPTLHWYDNGVIHYPSEADFLATVKTILKARLNLTLPNEMVHRLTKLTPSNAEKDILNRRKEMDALWILLQDNEYLLAMAFAERDVFPHVIGTCGNFFAVEYLEPIEGVSGHFIFGDDKMSWSTRIRTAIQIIELIDELENGFREPFHLCDIQLSHFGYSPATNRLKFLDLFSVYPKSIISASIHDYPPCHDHSDCELADCRATCTRTTKRCSKTVVNNNLQIVCEKLFLGWKYNRILIPGLLMTDYTPNDLAFALRQCANPSGEDTGIKPRAVPDEDIKKRLYSILTEIEQSVNIDFY